MPENQDNVFVSRIRGFLTYLRPKITSGEFDVDRLAQLRRVSDIRIRQFKVRKPQMCASDLCRLISPGEGRVHFDSLALQGGLFTREQLLQPYDPYSEPMVLFVETALLLEVLSHEEMLREIVGFLEADRNRASEPPPPTEEAPKKSKEIPERVAKLLGNITDLWSIPEMTQKLLTMLNRTDTPIEAVARELEKDPGLSTQVLRVVNSAYYSLQQKIGSVQRAIVSLGYNQTKRLVMMSSLISKLGQEHGDIDFDLRAFWGHSLWVAHAASILSRHARSGSADEHFTAGLLHDIGKLVEYQYLRVFMRTILGSVKQGSPYDQAERRVLQTDHTEIGACVCEKWGFPGFVVEAVRHHLDPIDSLEDLPIHRQAMVVCVVCALEKRVPESDLASWCGLLNITPDRFAEVKSEATQLSLQSLRDVFVFR